LRESKESVKKGFKGIYVLVIQVSGDIKVCVGALGEMAFAKGLYAYVGSAQINIEQRIKRHLRIEKRKFWHIDYLIDNPAAKVVKVFLKEGEKAEECKTAKRLSRKSEPVAGFGCSDCNCKSHLFHIKNYQFIQEAMQVFPKET
jgi:Uri superfamily endonuclease